MDSLTIEIDEDLAAELRRRARQSGRSPAEEAKQILQSEVGRTAPAVPPLVGSGGAERFVPDSATRSPREAARIMTALRDLGRPAPNPFDLKSYRDEFWNFVD